GNVSIKIEDTDIPDVFEVSGRGEMQISVLIESMRREGYEFSVSRPEIIVREMHGQRREAVEDEAVAAPPPPPVDASPGLRVPRVAPGDHRARDRRAALRAGRGRGDRGTRGRRR